MKFSGELLQDLGNLNRVPLIWGVYKVNTIPEVQVTRTRMDQWEFQGIDIMWEILGMLFSRDLLRDLANLNGVPLIQGSLYTWGNNNIVEGALARFGKISMEFLHLGGFRGHHCEIWENLNGVPSFGGQQGNHCEIWENLNGVPSFGGQQGNHCEIWENLNGVPSLGGFIKESTVVSKVQVTNTRMDQ